MSTTANTLATSRTVTASRFMIFCTTRRAVAGLPR
jgi:hypothetical protein